ncbi:MAG TPA: hypothetical protein VEW48_19240 [Thermoanaerobaculia bacterium]|nr:hypothetical protein [Thermoanaerobaculia bacterium]
MRSRPARSLALPFVLLLAACGSVKTPTEPEEPGGGATPFTFSRIQAEIFTPNCVKSGCHDAATASGGQILAAGRAYNQIVNVPSTESSFDRIEPGDPERSYMVKKLRGDPDITGDRMPLDQPGGLSQEQIDGLIAWVRAGALNN